MVGKNYRKNKYIHRCHSFKQTSDFYIHCDVDKHFGNDEKPKERKVQYVSNQTSITKTGYIGRLRVTKTQ